MSKTPPLLGLDHFMLALEMNDTSKGTSGHTCRYILELEGQFDSEKFKQMLEENEMAQWLSSLTISSTYWKKKWKHASTKKILLEELYSDEVIPKKLAKISLKKEKSPLFFFTIVRGKKTRLIFSWHHLLMDGYGAVLFLENLLLPIKVKPTFREKSKISLSILKECIKAKKFVDITSKGTIETMENSFTKEVEQSFRFLSFTKSETEKIEKNALKNGSLFGISSYFLACSSIVVANHLTKKKENVHDFWIPVPQDTRKKGSKWPITGNHLSFLFYRIKSDFFEDKKQLTKDIHQQMLTQIKEKIPSAYAHLMNYMRIIPTSIYARMIKTPNGKSLSSFLFTVAAEHPKSISSINHCKITNAISVPPNSYPPGLTFAFNRFENRIQIVIPYYTHLFTEKEMNAIEKDLQSILLRND